MFNPNVIFAVLHFNSMLYNSVMMILRLTTKAFRKFGQKPQVIVGDEKSENDFGDWYVNTADSFNDGNLFVPVMHANSLYTMFVPLDNSMSSIDLAHAVFANLKLRLMRLEISHDCAEKIMKSYGGQAVFAKTQSRSLIGNLSNLLKDIEVMVQYCDDIFRENALDLVRLEYKANCFLRTMNGKYIWPLPTFYSCIRDMCPELPVKIPLPLENYSTQGIVVIRSVFQGEIPERLLLKVEGAILGAEVLFNYMEVRALINVVNDSKLSSDIPDELRDDLKRILNFNIQKFEIDS